VTTTGKLGVALGALALAGCSLVHQRAELTGPQSRPGADEGMLLYTVGRLSFEAPADWEAQGDPLHVVIVRGGDEARIDARRMDRTFHDDDQCLSQAEQSLARGSGRLTNVRRHPTTLAGLRALVQEADQPGWHGWAWAVCDRGEQYRISFTGRSPLDEEALRVVRLLGASAILGSEPSA
jgi:hypothetical protein